MVREPQYIVDTVDNEGWPDALEWLSGEDFGDPALNLLIDEAYRKYQTLTSLWGDIKFKLEELGANVYIE